MEGFLKYLNEEMTQERPEMLPEIAVHYEHLDSRFPDWVRISFTDGSTAVYDVRTEQPAPLIRENIRIIRKWKTGYQYQQPPRRRRGRK